MLTGVADLLQPRVYRITAKYAYDPHSRRQHYPNRNKRPLHCNADVTSRVLCYTEMKTFLAGCRLPLSNSSNVRYTIHNMAVRIGQVAAMPAQVFHLKVGTFQFQNYWKLEQSWRYGNEISPYLKPHLNIIMPPTKVLATHSHLLQNAFFLNSKVKVFFIMQVIN